MLLKVWPWLLLYVSIRLHKSAPGHSGYLLSQVRFDSGERNSLRFAQALVKENQSPSVWTSVIPFGDSVSVFWESPHLLRQSSLFVTETAISIGSVSQASLPYGQDAATWSKLRPSDTLMPNLQPKAVRLRSSSCPRSFRWHWDQTAMTPVSKAEF